MGFLAGKLDVFLGNRGETLLEYTDNPTFDVLDTWEKRDELKYTCCPQPYVLLNFNLKLRFNRD